MGNSTKDSTSPILSMLGELAQAGAVILAFFYFVGLLIVNCDLASYGLLNLGLARPEYILAGGLFTFLMALGCITIFEAKREWRESTARTRFHRLLRTAMPISLLPGLGFYLLSDARLATVIIFVVGILFLQAIMWGPFSKFLTDLNNRPNRSPSALNAAERSYFGWQLGSLSFTALITLVFYTVLIFPVIPRQWGGGAKPLVTLYLNAGVQNLRTSGLPVLNDGRTIGPVRWLLDTDGMVAVAKDLPMKNWLRILLPPEHSRAVLLDRRLVAAVVYSELEWEGVPRESITITARAPAVGHAPVSARATSRGQ